MVLSRIFRRGRGFAERSAELAGLFQARGVAASPVEGGGARRRGDERVVARVDLEGEAVASAELVELSGGGAMHGRRRVAGLHGCLPVERAAESWPRDWGEGLVRSTRIFPRTGLGQARDAGWEPSDPAVAGARRAAELLNGSAGLHDRLLALLRDPSVIDCRVAPEGERLRLSVYRVGETALGADADFVLLCGRVLAEGEGFEPPGRR